MASKRKINLCDEIRNFEGGQIILDTCAIIELETMARKEWGYKKASRLLEDLAKKVDFIIPQGVQNELIAPHYSSYNSNNRALKISENTLELVYRTSKMPEEVKTFQKENQEKCDNLLYDLSLFSADNPNLRDKKRTRDPISNTDLEINNISVLMSLYNQQFLDSKKVIVFSSDEHIIRNLRDFRKLNEYQELREVLKPLDVNRYELEAKL